ncbi:DinB family protein [Cytobacillus firmus]|uniref:DinB-like domain-containing protein n=1 Tax=Cytobacillus firmus DS1 TaxID=1307436 RepID=W7L1Q9_CYTFI|nr:DinB family protein [Cytobacillus firmus]EWG12298.1 hypothetical protein PBF_05873 [Cytobacillus firmus DS1]
MGVMMNKENIIKVKKSLIDWSASLKNISTELWFEPFKKGSWGTADVISHFISWDKFMIENRINCLLRKEDFPQITVDAEAINKEASIYARSGISKEDLISEFINIRTELLSLIDKIPDDQFSKPCPGKEHITLGEYFTGMAEHDIKHVDQINKHLN